MAIPFNLPPPDPEPQPENYRRQLLLDIYEILRLILIGQRGSTGDSLEPADGSWVSGGGGAVEDEERSRDGAQGRRNQGQREGLRKQPRRKRRHVVSSRRQAHSVSIWLNIGIQVRQIAQDYRTDHQVDDMVIREKRIEVKVSSLFSLLAPASVSGSLWTTFVIIVGWKLLTRHHR